MTLDPYWRRALLLVITACLSCGSVTAQTPRKKTITRVFWQDADTQKLSYADLSTTDRWHIKRGWVKGFPDVDSKTQTLGPMVQLGKQLAVAIAGSEKSQIVRIDSGVAEQPHGNHFHWTYNGTPNASWVVTTAKPLQMATTHLDAFWFGHAGGFVKVQSNSSTGNRNPATAFTGGGEKMTLAITQNSLALAGHGDSSGDNLGRVDVVNLLNPNTGFRSFTVSKAPIDSIAAIHGKAFFGQSDGIRFSSTSTWNDFTTKIVDGSKTDSQRLAPIRFAKEKNWLLYTESAGKPGLCMINAAASTASVTRLEIPTPSGLRLSTPKTKLSLGKRFAFLFQERTDPESDLQENLIVVSLDPNRDMDFSDAYVVKTMPVGKSKIDGANGHHQICFDAYGRFAIYSDPGDGIISIMTVNDLKVRARFRVGGVPDKIVAVGAPEHFH